MLTCLLPPLSRLESRLLLKVHGQEARSLLADRGNRGGLKAHLVNETTHLGRVRQVLHQLGRVGSSLARIGWTSVNVSSPTILFLILRSSKNRKKRQSSVTTMLPRTYPVNSMMFVIAMQRTRSSPAYCSGKPSDGIFSRRSGQTCGSTWRRRTN